MGWRENSLAGKSRRDNGVPRGADAHGCGTCLLQRLPQSLEQARDHRRTTGPRAKPFGFQQLAKQVCVVRAVIHDNDSYRFGIERRLINIRTQAFLMLGQLPHMTERRLRPMQLVVAPFEAAVPIASKALSWFTKVATALPAKPR